MTDHSKLTVRRIIDADPDTLWDALTDEKIMQKWFFASGEGWSATVENELKVGGAYKIDMHSPKDSYSHEGFTKRS